MVSRLFPYSIDIDKTLSETRALLGDMSLHQISHAIILLKENLHTGRRVFVFGNGGSATTASHFACDLSKSAHLLAATLSEIALLTAWANDTEYPNVFAAQLKSLVEPGDVVVGISASGNSQNVLNGINMSKDNGARTIGFSGEGGRLEHIVDAPIVVPSSDIEQIEDAHLIICHIITKCLREV